MSKQPEMSEEESGRLLAKLVQGFAALTAVGASLGGFVVLLSLWDKLDAFAGSNKLEERARLIDGMSYGGATVFAFTILFMVGMRVRGNMDHPAVVERVHRFGLFMLPLSVCLLIPFLFRATMWKGSTLELVVLIAALGLLLEMLFRTSLASVPAVLKRAGTWLEEKTPAWAGRWVPWVVVLAAVVLYVWFSSYYTILHHKKLGTACFDLGQYDNLYFNASIGHPFKIPSLAGEEDWSSLKGHAELGMYVILPFYMIDRGPETLLIIQSVLLGTAAIPLFLMGKRYVSPWAAMLIAVSYIFYAPLIRSNFYDFHMQPVAAAFIMWMVYFFTAKKNIPFWIFFLCALTAREDISIGLAVFGMFLMLTGHRVRIGIAVFCISVAYFVVLKFIVMPMFGEWWFARIYKQLGYPGEKGFGSIIKTLITNPGFVFKTLITEDKLVYALQILTPVLFLPLRRTYLAMAILPGFVFTLLTTGYKPTVLIRFQYNAHYIPYIFPAAVVMLKVLGGGSPKPDVPHEETPPQTIKRRAALAAMMCVALVSSFQFGALLQRENFVGGFRKIVFEMTDKERQTYADLTAITAQVPPGASIAATEYLAPHVSSRSSLYCFRGSIGPAEYVLVGPRDRSGRVRKTLKKLMNQNKLGVIAEQGGFVLLRRGADPSNNKETIRKLRL